MCVAYEHSGQQSSGLVLLHQAEPISPRDARAACAERSCRVRVAAWLLCMTMLLGCCPLLHDYPSLAC